MLTIRNKREQVFVAFWKEDLSERDTSTTTTTYFSFITTDVSMAY